MSRVVVDLPDKLTFSTVIPVRVSDVNYGGHLGNDALLSMLHEARVRLLSEFGFSELDIGGVGIIMRDVAIVYRSEGKYGDKLLFELGVAGFTGVGFDVYYKVTNQRSGKPVAEAKTGIVCFDYAQRSVRPVPESFRNQFL
jgi:acyl-CoA thioesterase FadM